MLHKMKIVFATLAFLLGVAHLVFGVVSYDGFTLELMWFLGAGIAMMVTALANFNTDRNWVLRTQNALTLAFVIALLIVAPLPQVWVGLGLFAGLFLISVMKVERTKI